VHRPLLLRVAGVLEPDDPTSSLPGPGGRNHVEFAVAVNVGGERLERTGQFRQDVFLPGRAVAGFADVLVPDNLADVGIKHADGHHHVQVAVAVEVNGVAVDG